MAFIIYLWEKYKMTDKDSEKIHRAIHRDFRCFEKTESQKKQKNSDKGRKIMRIPSKFYEHKYLEIEISDIEIEIGLWRKREAERGSR